MTNDRTLLISVGSSRKAAHWAQCEITWAALAERLKTPILGKESHTAYMRMPKAQQDQLKDIGGFVGGALRGGRRKQANVLGRDLLTLDLDAIPAGGTEAVKAAVSALGCASCVYSTRKHEPGKPRLRVVIPLSRTVTAEEYEPVARRVGGWLGIEQCDPTTFQSYRLMYWPSASADSEFVYDLNDGEPLDPDGVLAGYRNWRDVTEWPAPSGQAKALREYIGKQEDPEAKAGLIGAFCRCYDIRRAMDELIPGTYAPTDDPDRYTYTGGSTSGGAIVYDGRWLYSHHATDPCSDTLVNAFDLVRLHKFADSDADAAENTPANRLPSYKAMQELAGNLPEVKLRLLDENRARAEEDFGRADDAPGPDDPDGSWRLALDMSGGRIRGSLSNLKIIFAHDPALQPIARDAFQQRNLVLGSLPWDAPRPRADAGDGLRAGQPSDLALRSSGRADDAPRPRANAGDGLRAGQPSDLALRSSGRADDAPRPRAEAGEGVRDWTDDDDTGAAWYIERNYGITDLRRIKMAADAAFAARETDSLKGYLDGLTWDGVPRADRLLVDYLKADDTPYTRAVTRKFLAGAVARAYEPGAKFDTVLTLTGPQGIGKSLLLGLLGGPWYSDNVQTFTGKEAAEQLRGIWLVEIAEVDRFSAKVEAAAVKQFITRQDDIYREPYARRTAPHPRRCVFAATTNAADFLTDATGNRRWWVVRCHATADDRGADLEGLRRDRDQIWAEAVALWRAGEPLTLDAGLYARAVEAQEQALVEDAWEGIVAEFAARKVPPDWDARRPADRRTFWAEDFGRGPEESLVDRRKLCVAEIWYERFGRELSALDGRTSRRIMNILRRLPGWRELGPRPTVYGGQKCFGIAEILPPPGATKTTETTKTTKF